MKKLSSFCSPRLASHSSITLPMYSPGKVRVAETYGSCNSATFEWCTSWSGNSAGFEMMDSAPSRQTILKGTEGRRDDNTWRHVLGADGLQKQSSVESRGSLAANQHPRHLTTLFVQSPLRSLRTITLMLSSRCS